LAGTPFPYPTIDSNGKFTLTARTLALIFAIILPAAAAVVAIIFIQTADLDRPFPVPGDVSADRDRSHGGLPPAVYPSLVRDLSLGALRPGPHGWSECAGSPDHLGVAASSTPRLPRRTGRSAQPLSRPQPGFKGALKALWHSHYGHIFNQIETVNPRRYVPDLEREPFLRALERYSGWVVAASFALPFVAGWLISGTLLGGITGMLWGGFVRLFVVTHATGAVNSICHFFGTRRFDLSDESRNVWWLAPFTLGESWHQNHHAFPTSARHGLLWWEIDPSWWFIFGMERVGLAWNVVRIDAERQRAKSLPADHVGP